MANSLLGQEPRTVDKRIEATIRDELDYLNKYGADYWNSGTTGLLGWGAFSAAQQSLGASGRGERAVTQLQTINNQMKGGYSDEDLWNMFNDELINTFPENDEYRLAMDLIDRDGSYGGGDVEREGYSRGGISRLASKGAKAIKSLLGEKKDKGLPDESFDDFTKRKRQIELEKLRQIEESPQKIANKKRIDELVESRKLTEAEENIRTLRTIEHHEGTGNRDRYSDRGKNHRN